MNEMLWHCDKCKKELPKEELTELFAWALYVCTPCILEWIPETKVK